MQIHITRAGKALGPYNEEQLTDAIERGDVSYDDLAWTEGMTDWLALREICVPPAGSRPPQPPPIPVSAPSSQTAPNAGPEIGISKPRLWNPNAAVKWSLLFSPIFGAWIHAKNWRELNHPALAKQSMIWVAIGIILICAAPFLPASNGIAIGFFAAWYLASGRKQPEHMKTQGVSYVKRKWWKPILIATASLAGFLIYAVTIDGLLTPENKDSRTSQPTEAIHRQQDSLSTGPGSRVLQYNQLSAESIYAASGEEAIEKAKRYVIGTWTYTGQGMKADRGEVYWERWVLKPDGTIDMYLAAATRDNWGAPETHPYEIITGKFSDSGKRYYAIKVSACAYPVIIKPNGKLRVKSADWDIEMERGDQFPFSK